MNSEEKSATKIICHGIDIQTFPKFLQLRLTSSINTIIATEISVQKKYYLSNLLKYISRDADIQYLYLKLDHTTFLQHKDLLYSLTKHFFHKKTRLVYMGDIIKIRYAIDNDRSHIGDIQKLPFPEFHGYTKYRTDTFTFMFRENIIIVTFRWNETCILQYVKTKYYITSIELESQTLTVKYSFHNNVIKDTCNMKDILTATSNIVYEYNDYEEKGNLNLCKMNYDIPRFISTNDQYDFATHKSDNYLFCFISNNKLWYKNDSLLVICKDLVIQQILFLPKIKINKHTKIQIKEVEKNEIFNCSISYKPPDQWKHVNIKVDIILFKSIVTRITNGVSNFIGNVVGNVVFTFKGMWQTTRES